LQKVPAVLLDGRKIADGILNDVKDKVSSIDDSIKFAIILVGNDESSNIFIRMKQKACERVGVETDLHKLEEDVDKGEIISLIKTLNNDKNTHGIIVQLPLPKPLDENKILGEISPLKDVDGLTPHNIGNLLLGNEMIVPATVEAVVTLLENTNINLEGKDVVIINRSNLIGKPLSMILTKKSATVSLCHTKTNDLASHVKRADIIITATGTPQFLTGDMIKGGSIVIDIGCMKFEGKTCGDVDFETVSQKTSYITPVPGGVGPLTVAFTIRNVLRCFELQKSQTMNTEK